MRRKLTIMSSLLLAAVAAACVAAPSTAEQQSRVDGALYVMPGGFAAEVDSGRTVILSVALVLSEESGREWLTGVEQDRVRTVVDGTVAGASERQLVSAAGRRELASRLHRAIRSTGLPVESVLIPDLAVS
jgi:hypothetical protein